jgi:hypothetical protein
MATSSQARAHCAPPAMPKRGEDLTHHCHFTDFSVSLHPGNIPRPADVTHDFLELVMIHEAKNDLPRLARFFHGETYFNAQLHPQTLHHGIEIDRLIESGFHIVPTSRFCLIVE